MAELGGLQGEAVLAQNCLVKAFSMQIPIENLPAYSQFPGVPFE